MPIRNLAPIAAFLAVATALLVSPVYAHGFGERYNLPLPLNMFMIGRLGKSYEARSSPARSSSLALPSFCS